MASYKAKENVEDPANEGITATDIIAPAANDVLLGRGAGTNKHKGNMNFRNIVKGCQEDYTTAMNNYEKYLITMDILQKIHILDPPGRFITQDAKTKCWYDVGDHKARRKISQALRENAPDIKKGLKLVESRKEERCSSANEDSISFIKPTQQRPQLDWDNKAKLLYMNDMDLNKSLSFIEESSRTRQKTIVYNKILDDSIEEDRDTAVFEHFLDVDNFVQDNMDINKSLQLSTAFKEFGQAGSNNSKKSQVSDSSMLDLETSIGTFAIDDMSNMSLSKSSGTYT